MDKETFRNNSRHGRYEMDLNGEQIAVADYLVDGNDIVITHTGVPSEFTNRGMGAKLISLCLEDIKAQGCKVVPRCSFVDSYIRRHPEWKELVSENN